uniref:putative late blight resistance protein homolog R1C-3 n=1 Tax=Erigeron canadensis TaxID=72917 RepID=UPI001CB9AD88|nr:putative late blight resistance protein homolog R1C-3 [Erigeron canadensis]
MKGFTEAGNLVVRFNDEVKIIHQLNFQNSTKQLQVISIVGMAGLGKTTLAKTIYNDTSVWDFYDIQAWTSVSQVYQIKDLLLSLLSSLISELTDEIYKLSDTQLGELLYRKLKDRQYLVVFDDICDSNAWNDLKMYFPDDNIGSRVVFTSRDIDISAHIQAAGSTHVLHYLDEFESWDLFLQKTFQNGRCPSSLEDFGRLITRKCDGLPLAIVMASRLLKYNQTNEWWRQVAETLSLFIGNSSTALCNHLLGMMMKLYENVEVRDLLEGATDLDLKDFIQPCEYIDEVIDTCEKLGKIKYSSNKEGEVVVGFDEEVETLLDQLTSTSIKHLQVISIAGMAGLGKTTLATKLYNDPLVEYTFDMRAWTSVSQVYQVKDLLLGILSTCIHEINDEIYKMNDIRLGEKLYRLLKGHRYLVVLDDIWDSKAWNDLKMYFPDDKTGSRVLFTSRDIDITSHVQAARPIHVLRFRNEVESWDLLLKKTFRTGICPLSLEDFGRAITRKCEGLPLAIVIASGILKNNMSNEWWRQIAEKLSLFMVSKPSQYMHSLALSYNHLPPHLKPCFLFFRSFPEDYEVSVSKLIWLWIAQGFIQQSGSKTWEDVAEDFLMDLINRGLLMISKTRADGRIKACRIHDLLRDLCLRKSLEEKFSLLSYKYPSFTSSSATIRDMQYEILADTSPLVTHSSLCYPNELADILQNGRPIPYGRYKMLKVLDMEYVPISVFHSDVVHLIDLRYLAIQAYDGSLPSSISNLVHLQTLIISSKKNIVLPNTIWNMVNLRHLYIKSGENFIEEPKFVQVTEDNGVSNLLPSLQTLSQVSPESCQNVSTRTPTLRKLGFCGPLISSLGDLEFPNIRTLQHLEKLKLLNTIPYPEATRSCNPLRFPENLKKLTLCNTGLDWDEIWTFAWVPNLEVLKLKFQACIGERWETGEEAEFRRLQVLKLHDLDITNWVSYRDNFPRLKQLVVRRCSKTFFVVLHSIF